MKKHLLLFIVLCVHLNMRAEGKSLFISFNDGSKIEIAMTDNPEIKMADDKLTITYGTTENSYELWRLSKFTFGTTSTGIKDILDGKNIQMQNNQIIVADSNAQIRIFSIDGKALSVAPIHSGSKTIIDMNTFSKGVYVMNINGNSFKILKQ